MISSSVVYALHRTGYYSKSIKTTRQTEDNKSRHIEHSNNLSERRQTSKQKEKDKTPKRDTVFVFHCSSGTILEVAIKLLPYCFYLTMFSQWNKTSFKKHIIVTNSKTAYANTHAICALSLLYMEYAHMHTRVCCFSSQILMSAPSSSEGCCHSTTFLAFASSSEPMRGTTSASSLTLGNNLCICVCACKVFAAY